MPASGNRLLLAALCLFAILFGDLALHSSVVAHIAVALHRTPPDPLQHLFWDSFAYADGIGRVLQHRSPYDNNPGNIIFYAYSPLFAWAGAVLARIVPPTAGHLLYDSVYLLSVCALQLVLAAFFLRRLTRSQVAALLCLAPICVLLSPNFWSGNMHLVFYFAAMLTALPGLRHGRWLPFYLVTVFCAASHPVFLVLLLLPILAGRRQLISSILIAFGTAAIYLVQRLTAPSTYADYQHSITVHMAATRDFGEGISGITAVLLPHAGLIVPALFQLAFSLTIVGTLAVLQRQVQRDDPRWWALLILAIALVNPRLMPYDSVIALVPALYFLLRGTGSPARWLTALGITAVCFVLHRHVGITPLLLVGFLLGSRVLAGRASHQPDPLNA